MKGVILYDGPSVLTGDPIVAIATFRSQNRKTGDMIQTWILRSDMSPLDASQQSADDAVCGNCPLRRSLNGACYVNIGQAPQNVWKSYQRDLYPHYSKQEHATYFRHRRLRLGAYGDPAAVPYDIWAPIVGLVERHTGYTHQWRHPNFDPRIADLCMVSVHTAEDAIRASKKERPYFRVKRLDEPELPGEAPCLAEYTKGATNCSRCMLCHGQSSHNIVINVHGSLNGRF